MLQKFWEIDSSAVEVSPITCENKRILEHTQSTIQLADGQYRVSIPWKKDKMDLPNSYLMAFRCIQSLEKTLVKNPKVAKAYQETICKYLEKGYIREIGQTETSKPKWY